MSVSKILLGDVEVELGAVVEVLAAIAAFFAHSRAFARVSLSLTGIVVDVSARCVSEPDGTGARVSEAFDKMLLSLPVFLRSPSGIPTRGGGYLLRAVDWERCRNCSFENCS